MTEEGKRFERAFANSVPADVYCERFPDAAVGFNAKEKLTGGAPIIGNNKNNKIRFAPKSPYDFILYKRPELFCIELKTAGTSNFSFSGKSANIKDHQIRSLLKASKYANAGLILNFRKTSNTYYLEINDFCRIKETLNKKSFNEKDIINYAIELPHKLMRTNYKYDLSPLFHMNNYKKACNY